MSYNTWHEYGYGIRMREIEYHIQTKFTEEERYNRLLNLLDLAPVFKKEYLTWVNGCVGDEIPTWELLMDYENDYCIIGLYGIIQKVIEEKYNIDIIACSDFDGEEYLIFGQCYVWDSDWIDLHKHVCPAFLDKMFNELSMLLCDIEVKADYQEVENGG